MKKPMIFEGVVAILIIILLFAMYLMVSSSGQSGTPANTKWLVAGNDTVSNLFIGKDGILYAFMGDSGNAVYAIDSGGKVKWEYDIPAGWRAINEYRMAMGNTQAGIGSTEYNAPIFSEDNGTLYLLLRENKAFPSNESNIDIGQRIIAISPEGKLMWNVSIGHEFHPYDQAGIYASGGRIYVFSSYNETVFDSAGKALFAIPDVSDPPAIDENGFIYAVKDKVAGNAFYSQDPYYRFMEPSGIIEAYGPDGTLCWRENVTNIIRESWQLAIADGGYTSLPIYQNNTLYLPVQDGICVLKTDGSVRWNRSLGAESAYLYDVLPIDARGNVYFTSLTRDQQPWLGGKWSIDVIESGGNDTIHVYTEPRGGSGDPLTGVLYYWSNHTLTGNASDDALLRVPMPEITAYDIANNRTLWNRTLPVGEPRVLTIDSNNASDKSVDPGVFEEAMRKNEEYKTYPAGTAPTKPYYPMGGFNMKIIPDGDIVYVSYYTDTYEVPLVLNVSRYAYAGGVYALDRNGTLLWYKHTDALITAMAANNSTVYYGTRGGEIASGQVGLAGSLALTAIAYVLIRFFMAGTIARARSRIGLNENRNSVLRYVAERPGSTMSEISRSIGMNLGTVRYHLLILSINHRIVGQRTDGKSIRYFTNAGSYDAGEQSVISLMRRDHMRKVLELLNEKPGLSNRELSKALNMQESAASRYMRELMEKGVVIKEPAADGASAYFIKNEHRQTISSMMERP